MFYRARYYNPGIGRFTSEDPSGFQAGINFYIYTTNGPIINGDPSGLLSIEFDWRSKCKDIFIAIRNIRDRVCSTTNEWCKPRCASNPAPDCNYCEMIPNPDIKVRWSDVSTNTTTVVGIPISFTFYGSTKGNVITLHPPACKSMRALEQTLMHEMTHVCGYGTEAVPYKVADPRDPKTGCY